MLISIQDARPGMILLNDIPLPSGGLLAKKQQTLSPELISQLITGKIENIDVYPLPSPSVKVVIADDLMSASLIVEPGGENPAKISGEELKNIDECEIRSLLRGRGVIYGVNEQAIRNLTGDFQNGRYPLLPVSIAGGEPPCNGKDGALVFHFNTETSLRPQLNSDGSADYKTVNMVNSVVKGQTLVTLISPEAGIPGKTVTGEPVEAQYGSPVTLPEGENTLIDPEAPDSLKAGISGTVRYTGTKVEVQEECVIPGDVDFSTGNISYEKTVTVEGDVKSGFSIQCGGDLQVNGTIEDCRLLIDGNVLGKSGFIGQGKGIIEAGGDVNLGFMKNQTIKCRHDVNIAREAINCTIYAKNSIYIHGNPRSIAGGVLIAGNRIVLNTVGNHSGVKTILEVGLDFTLIDMAEKTKQKLEELSFNLAKLESSQGKYVPPVKLHKQLPSENPAPAQKISEAIVKYKQQIKILEEHKNSIDSHLHNFSNALIRIEHLAFAGTLFKFGERHLLVKEEIPGPKTVRLIGHEIRII